MVDRLRESLEKLGKYGKLSEGGVFRSSFSDADIEARKFIVSLMKEANLDIYMDAAGNIIGIRKGEIESPVVMTGSHIDAGMRWGIFDGTLGVIGAIEAVRQIDEEGFKTKLPLAIACFTDEEGAFIPLAGSKFFAGLISKDELYRSKNKYDGTMFGEVVKKAFDINGIKKIFERIMINIKYYLELHIEQGPILESLNKEIGIVTGIVGIRWVNLNFKGTQSHAGTTPMNLRRDPMIPAAKAILALRDVVLKYNGMVGTAGAIKVSPNVVNAIPGEVIISMDIRSLKIEELNHVATEIIELAKKFSSEENVDFSFTINEAANPVLCDKEIVNILKDISERNGYSYIYLPSRAGHDAQNVAKLTKIGMIFVPSKKGISHSPEEWTDWEHCNKGVKVLKESLLELSYVRR